MLTQPNKRGEDFKLGISSSSSIAGAAQSQCGNRDASIEVQLATVSMLLKCDEEELAAQEEEESRWKKETNRLKERACDARSLVRHTVDEVAKQEEKAITWLNLFMFKDVWPPTSCTDIAAKQQQEVVSLDSAAATVAEKFAEFNMAAQALERVWEEATRAEEEIKRKKAEAERTLREEAKRKSEETNRLLRRRKVRKLLGWILALGLTVIVLSILFEPKVKWSWRIEYGFFNDDVLVTNLSPFPIHDVVVILEIPAKRVRETLKADRIESGGTVRWRNVISVPEGSVGRATLSCREDN